MPSFWSYSDPADRGFGLFKRRLLHALRQHGIETHLAEAPLLEPESKNKIRQHLLSAQPDWLLLINQTAAQFYDYIQLAPQQRPLPQKKLVWFLDDPHFFVNQPFEPHEYVLSFDETYLGFLKQKNPGAAGFMPLAADISEAGTYDERFACEVCFVGGVIDQSERRSQLSQPMREYVDGLVEKKINQRSRTFSELAALYPIQPGKQITITPQVAHYLYWEANNRYRLSVMQALADYDLRLYGNAHWEKLLRGTPLHKKFYGPCDPVHELPNLFATVPININLHSLQCLGSLNQRDFNAPVSGGFLLSDWVNAAGRYFVPGREAVYWSTINELRAKIDYYLAHPNERWQRIQIARQRVKQAHTYALRVEQLLQCLKSRNLFP